MATSDKVSYDVYLSREENRNLIIAELKKYLELENVDLTKSSFLSFIVEALATVTSNLMFYQTSVYREFFLTKAQLPDSIYNLSAFLGYDPSLASYATTDVLFTIPFGFSDPVTEIVIPVGFKAYASDDVTFSTYYETTIEITNNSAVRITAQEGTKVFNIPVVIEDDYFAFAINFRQLTEDIQEFQIASDLQVYQFVNLDVPFDSKLAEILVEVREPNQTGWDTYTLYNSLYLMDENTKGYILRRTDDGVNVAFGNGIIGYQPPPSSTVRFTLTLTQGEDGNVISGTIRSAERIYNETDAGVTELVSYEVVNPIAATGGEDEEGVEEVRRNSIINLTALERTVTEDDYVNSNIIIDNSPIGPNSLPVLKRSDVKVNEICLFITLLYLGEIVPTRNAFTQFNTTEVPRKTIVNINGVDFYTMFDMTINALNTVADYQYVLFDFAQVPTLITSFNSDYDLYADNLLVSTGGTDSVTYRLKYNSTALDYDQVTAQMQILETGAVYNMVNDTTANEFILEFPNYSVIDEGELTYYFTLQHPSEGLIGRYQNTFILIQSLVNYTRSNVVIEDSTTYTVYDIPVIEKEFYDSIDQQEFETLTLQSFLTSLQFQNYKMLTDFVNIKFGNTIGSLQNMQLNEVNTLPVIDFKSDPGNPCGPDFPCTNGDRYIVFNGQGEFAGHEGEIAQCALVTDATSIDSTTVSWYFTEPNTDDIVYVTNKGYKYIYGAAGWVLPNYMIPLQIKLDVFQTSEYTGSISDLAASVREALVEGFSDRFGIEADLYRSEIVDIVQNVDGVEHCRLIKPGSNIFFNFDLINLTQEQLLEYGPEYVYFTEDDIEVKIFK
jgi:hypothetical protein